jgi:hypothetical protein
MQKHCMGVKSLLVVYKVELGFPNYFMEF